MSLLTGGPAWRESAIERSNARNSWRTGVSAGRTCYGLERAESLQEVDSALPLEHARCKRLTRLTCFLSFEPKMEVIAMPIPRRARNTRLGALAVLLIPAIYGAGLLAPCATFAQETGRCVALIIADTNDPAIGRHVRLDMINMARLFEQNIPPASRVLVRRFGDQVAPDGILAAVDRAPVGPQDALVVYYAGHGAFDQRGQFLATGAGPLHRGDLLAAIRRKAPRLGVLITDTCSVYQASPAMPAVPTPKSGPVIRPAARISPAFWHLLWKTRGMVDLSGSKPGQYAYGNDQLGGIFTASLCDTLSTHSHRPLTWEAVSQHANSKLQVLFRQMYPRGAPTPQGVQLSQEVFFQRDPGVITNPARFRRRVFQMREGTRFEDQGSRVWLARTAMGELSGKLLELGRNRDSILLLDPALGIQLLLGTEAVRWRPVGASVWYAWADPNGRWVER